MGNRRILWSCLTAAAILCVSISQTSVAQSSKSDLVFILDGSGSMWGRVAGKMKIAAAKEVMGDLLRDVPADVQVGFVAYGHRHKGDCSDIQTIAPLGTDPAAISTKIDAITPHGRTPITESLKQAAALVAGDDAMSTLVLVSDGIETCKGDPCALANSLRAANAKTVIHTVGLGVGGGAVAQLQCIAKAGGGNYYHVSDTAGLHKALFAVRDAAARQEVPPPPPQPPAAPKVKTGSKVIKLKGPGTIVLKPAPWVKMPAYYWKILDAETGTEKGTAKQARLRAREGEYQIVWRQTEHYNGDVPLTAVVGLRSGKTVEVPIDTGLQITVPKGIKAPYWWSLTLPDEKKASFAARETLDPQVVPAGRYVLRWRQTEHYSPTVEFGTVEIAAGKLNRRILDSGIQVAAADWVPGTPYFVALVASDGKTLGQWRDDEALKPQLVGPGTYQAIYRQTEHSHTDIPLGKVVVPEHGFAQVDVNSGVRFKPQQGVKPPYRVFFVPLDGGKEYVWHGRFQGKWAPVPLPPGRYRLDWWEDEHESERMTLLDEFEIEPGTLVEFEM